MSCPGKDSVERGALFLPGRCGDDLEITEVLGSGTRETITGHVGTESPACCYPVEVTDDDPSRECAVGRPYFEDGQALVPSLVADAVGTRPEDPRAAAWAKAGAAEHASIAAFARLALQLLRHAAPSSLLDGVHRAALDEIRHAEICFSLVEKFGGGRVRPGALPLTGADASVSLAELAAAAVLEGCLAETLGAHVTEVAASLSPEPDVRAALASIAEEEATHAVLSFRIVAWALRTGGPEVRAAARAAAMRPWPRLDVAELAVRSQVDVALLARAAERGVAEVLEPAVSQLFS